MRGFERLTSQRLIPAGGGPAGFKVFVDGGTNTFTVPEGVPEICVLAVGGNYGRSEGLSYLQRSGITLCSAYGPDGNSGGSGGVKEGGGNGGSGRSSGSNGDAYVIGGGAGGYTGDGASAVSGYLYDDDPSVQDAPPGGGGAAGPHDSGPGGGIGIFGIGPGGNQYNQDGSRTFMPELSKFGAGLGYYQNGYVSDPAPRYGAGGGETSWVNNIPVSPGEVLDVRSGQRWTSYVIDDGRFGDGVLAIFWGLGTFPELSGAV